MTSPFAFGFGLFVMLASCATPNQLTKNELPFQAPTQLKIPEVVAPQTTRTGFDLNIERLPPGFRGDDLGKVRSRLQGAIPKRRGEYETSVNYEFRIAGAASTQIVSGRQLDSIFAFSFVVEPYYDADNQRYLLAYDYLERTLPKTPRTTLDQLKIGEGRQPGYISWKTTSLRDDTYTGANAFGLSKTVTRSAVRSLALAVCPTGKNCSSIPTQDAIVAVPTLSAPQLKYRLRVLIIGTLVAPYVGATASHTRPTLNHPFDFKSEMEFVSMLVEQLWIYDAQTGEVFRRLRVKPSG